MQPGRAVRFSENGDIRIEPLEVRAPGPDELLVEVAAAGLNRADLLQRMGRYPAPPGSPAMIPGLEYAGTVRAAGERVQGHAAGDRVMGIVGGGGMSTHLVIHEREVLPVPEGMSLEDAAAIPEAFLTAFDALFVQGGLRPFETVLIHAIGSGVGTAALQIAKAAGCRVLGTSRSPEKLERCAPLGLDEGIVTVQGGFAQSVLDSTAGRGADLILDTVGGAYLEENLGAIALQGRIVVVGLLGGAEGRLPLGKLLGKRARLVGTVLRSRPQEEKAILAQRFSREALPLFAAGQLRPVVEAVLPMEELEEAHRRLGENRTFGKLVLRW